MPSNIVSTALMLIGAAFLLLAAVGVTRMPDLFTRMQTTTKAATLGVGCVILSVAVHFGDLGVMARAAAVIVFVLLTAPVAAHMIARAAYLVGVRQWEGTIVDELRGRYDLRTGTLRSPGVNRSDTDADD
ncbi:MAG: monovalent cation/H(+) antiporter subunit G [Armatimonadota bacterium]|nr:monovalent cation/H(+) antiporter subunit G [Armatimonadota bacterium]MDR7451014.1 monovalent cation/H(+) antiporter subunit G [Armatimonadota bacterium]MDR7465965.1 monovalent cation/H(+) antiporter subunit G [Armatimonadota bacterium]MDR7494030.1 monovalent cation/H(+) antiporter subunit G [Armatimonadota bacterium]MDR7498480.1 monovalent cation/H(+) antiporter subunit G [Armatimonadota bacterium]